MVLRDLALSAVAGLASLAMLRRIPHLGATAALSIASRISEQDVARYLQVAQAVAISWLA